MDRDPANLISVLAHGIECQRRREVGNLIRTAPDARAGYLREAFDARGKTRLPIFPDSVIAGIVVRSLSPAEVTIEYGELNTGASVFGPAECFVELRDFFATNRL